MEEPPSPALQQLFRHVECVPQDASAMYLEALELIEKQTAINLWLFQPPSSALQQLS